MTKVIIMLIFASAIHYISVAADLSFLLLHNNDVHSKFEEITQNSGSCNRNNRGTKKCLAGFARTIHMVREYRRLAQEQKGPEVLFLNGGDVYTGSTWFNVHTWNISATFMNLLAPDVMVLGNHEFDFGVKGLTPFIDSITFPIVCANCDFKQNQQILQKVTKSVILNVGGVQIGVIGFITRDTGELSLLHNEVDFTDEVEAVKKESERLTQQGINIIIGLGHAGYQIEQKVAAEVPLVDIIVGGHTNTFLYNGPPPDVEIPEDVYPKIVTQANGKRVPVVQACAYTKYLGRLNVTFDDNGNLIQFNGQPLLLSSDISQDSDVLEILERFRPEVDALENQVIGKTRVLLEANDRSCRYNECNMGNLITDAFVAYAAKLSSSKYWTDVPIGMISGGCIRNSIDSVYHGGNITKGQLLEVLPYDNRMEIVSIKGSYLRKTLEAGVRSDGASSLGEFLQISGLQVVYDMAKPSGSRVVSAKARCGECYVPIYENLVDDKTYKLITVGFLVEGGDGHRFLKEGHFDKRVEALTDLEVLSKFIKEEGVVYAEVEGRSTFLNKEMFQKNEWKPSTASPLNKPKTVAPLMLNKASTLILDPTLMLLGISIRWGFR